MKKLAIIGYGKMGKKIEELAPIHGFAVYVTIDNEKDWIEKESLLKQCDVAVEFTMPNLAPQNLKRLAALKIPTVCGTTGWENEKEEVFAEVKNREAALLASANFSIGMNLFFSLNLWLAQLMNNHPDYEVSVEETHHIHKLDAPSGTAKALADGLVANLDKYKQWLYDGYDGHDVVPVTAIREGEVPGIHTIVYKGQNDKIEIKHEAFNRNGLAIGALKGAQWIIGKKGVFSMYDMLSDLPG